MARGEWLQKTYGDDLIRAMRMVKQAVDPQNLLNPGKLFDAPPMDTQLRFGEAYRAGALTPVLHFHHDNGLTGAIEQCNGQHYTYKNLAAQMMDKNIDLAAAEDLASTALGAFRVREENRLFLDKRLGKTDEEWLEFKNSQFASLLSFYGSVLSKRNKLSDAFDILAEAVRLGGRNDVELNEKYAEVLIKIKKPKVAMAAIGRIVDCGNDTPRIVALLKEAYIEDKGNDSGSQNITRH